MEIFIYMHMGGSLERVKVVPIYKSAGLDSPLLPQAAPLHATRARAELSEQFQNFDAAKAQCFKNSDRERLLAVIEAAFGDCTEFNKSARNLLTTRLSTSGHFHIGFGTLKKKVGSFVHRGARRLSIIGGAHPSAGDSASGRDPANLTSGRRSTFATTSRRRSTANATPPERRSTVNATSRSPHRRLSKPQTEARGSRASGGSQRRSRWSKWSSGSMNIKEQSSLKGTSLTSIVIGDDPKERVSLGAVGHPERLSKMPSSISEVVTE